MRARVPMLILLAMSLLVSCRGQGTVHAIRTLSGQSLYLRKNDAVIELRLPAQTLHALEESQSASEDHFFTLEIGNSATLDDGAGEARALLYASLAGALGMDDAILAAASHAPELRDSAFDETLERISPSFDEEAFLRDIEGASRHYVYDMDKVLSGLSEGQDVDAFMGLWLNSALNP